ncbi:MAG: hypothetical protein HY040_05990 [Planctomycetes bacterium]|nr:hypothetical protein [Planctomycetota bacterium]
MAAPHPKPKSSSPSPNDRSYKRIGLYFRKQDNTRINFCDVHFTWVTPKLLGVKDDAGNKGFMYEGGFPYIAAYYSGPTASIDQNLKSLSSQADMDTYVKTGAAAARLTLANGGVAYLSDPGMRAFIAQEIGLEPPDDGNGMNWQKVDRDRKMTVECWLRGPLLFGGQSYGSLVVFLTGTLKAGSDYQECVLRGSKYIDGHIDPMYRQLERLDHDMRAAESSMEKARGYHMEDAAVNSQKVFLDKSDAYTKLKKTYDAKMAEIRNTLYSIPLPDKVVRAEWQFESYLRNLSLSQATDQSG